MAKKNKFGIPLKETSKLSKLSREKPLTYIDSPKLSRVSREKPSTYEDAPKLPRLSIVKQPLYLDDRWKSFMKHLNKYPQPVDNKVDISKPKKR